MEEENWKGGGGGEEQLEPEERRRMIETDAAKGKAALGNGRRWNRKRDCYFLNELFYK
jgi:hypothetical protein